MKNLLKSKTILMLILLFGIAFVSLVSCEKEEKDDGTFTLRVNHSNVFSTKIESNSFESQFLYNGQVPIKGKVLENEETWLRSFEENDPSNMYNYSTFEPKVGGEYEWSSTSGDVKVISEPSTSGSNGLIGTWTIIDGCIAANGLETNFKFNRNGTGHLFQADCNSLCDDNGVYLYFNWTDNGNSVTLNYTGNNSYCGVDTEIPDPDVLDYSISGNLLSIAGEVFIK